jgi:hypothetical protein
MVLPCNETISLNPEAHSAALAILYSVARWDRTEHSHGTKSVPALRTRQREEELRLAQAERESGIDVLCSHRRMRWRSAQDTGVCVEV